MSSNCNSCRFHHGRRYNSVPLVCAIHPTGPADSGNCPDWEKVDPVNLELKVKVTIPDAFLSFSDAVERIALASDCDFFREAMRACSENIAQSIAAPASALFDIHRIVVEAQRVVPPLDPAQVERVVEQLSALSSDPPEEPFEAAIDLLSVRLKIKRAIARFRLEVFCGQHPHLRPVTLYRCLRDGRINLTHGRISPGRNFPPPP